MRKKSCMFSRVGNTRIIPISFKILFIFIFLLFASNFTTNYINLQLSKRQIIRLNNSVMIGQLKDIFATADNQYQIYNFSNDIDACVSVMTQAAKKTFTENGSLAMAFNGEGQTMFVACNDREADFSEVIAELVLSFEENRLSGFEDGSVSFNCKEGQYFGVYKYQRDWGCYFLRAELRKDTFKSTLYVMKVITVIIVAIVAIFLIIGIFMFSSIFSRVNKITASLYDMQSSQKLSLIDLEGAVNDDITYMAVAFNSLSATINNLLKIFQKFVPTDIVKKAYNEHKILLEGSRRNLTILFSDIKSFTYRTEALGDGIIDLLNIHYNSVIHSVHESNGVIGSIIGDAILAVYGTDDDKCQAISSVDSAWHITKLTQELRERMISRRIELEKTRPLTEAEERIYKAVLVDIGVGIDGGNVFYGNIGSNEHMANTVIGDNVNFANRLESLTRKYGLPVLVSEYIKNECEAFSNKYTFYEIDTVVLKGVSTGKKVYIPLETVALTDEIKKQYEFFEKCLNLYYQGNWDKARKMFELCSLDIKKVFIERMDSITCPKDWSGIWTMTTK